MPLVWRRRPPRPKPRIVSSVSRLILALSRIFCPLLLSCPSLVVALEAELKMLRHRSGPWCLLNRAPGQHYVRVWDIVDFGVHRGAAVALPIAEVYTGHRLQDLIGLPSSLSDEGLKDLLEGYDDVASRVVLRVSTHDIVRSAL